MNIYRMQNSFTLMNINHILK